MQCHLLVCGIEPLYRITTVLNMNVFFTFFFPIYLYTLVSYIHTVIMYWLYLIKKWLTCTDATWKSRHSVSMRKKSPWTHYGTQIIQIFKYEHFAHFVEWIWLSINICVSYTQNRDCSLCNEIDVKCMFEGTFMSFINICLLLNFITLLF